jgi:hypothetical protein
MSQNALQDYLVSGQIAFVGYSLKDPSVFGIVEVKIPEIGHDLFEQRSIPEEIFIEPERLVNFEAEG